jgi:hypothetical protein
MCVFMSDKAFVAEACPPMSHASASNGLSDIETHSENAPCNRPLTRTDFYKAESRCFILPSGKTCLKKRRLATLDITVHRHFISKVKKCWAWLVLGWVSAQMTSTPGEVRWCTRILWPGKASQRTPRGVIPHDCVKYLKKYLKKKTTASPLPKPLLNVTG